MHYLCTPCQPLRGKGKGLNQLILLMNHSFIEFYNIAAIDYFNSRLRMSFPLKEYYIIPSHEFNLRRQLSYRHFSMTSRKIAISHICSKKMWRKLLRNFEINFDLVRSKNALLYGIFYSQK